MTFTVNITGHDDLEAELKEAFENGLVAKAKQLVDDAKQEGVTISSATATTNTTGSVDLLDPGDDEEVPS